MRNCLCLLLAVAMGTCVLGNTHTASCTKGDFTDPSELMTTETICTVVEEGGTASDIAAYASGGFSATKDLPGAKERNGKQFFEDVINSFGDGGDEFPSSDRVSAYTTAIGILAAPGVFFFLFNGCSCFWCTCLHTCCCLCPTCCRSCKCVPSTRPYSCGEKTRPVVVWLVIGIAMLVSCILGVINGTYALTQSVVDAVCIMDDTYIRFGKFLDNVEQPMLTMEDKFQEAVDALRTATDYPPNLQENADRIAANFSEMLQAAETGRNNVQQWNPPPGFLTTEKQNCQDSWDEIVDKVKKAEAEAESEAQKIAETLQDLQKVLKDVIVEQETPVKDMIKQSSDGLADLKDQLDAVLDPRSYQLFNLAEAQRDYKDILALGQFAWAAAACGLTALAFLGMKFGRVERFRDEPPKNNPELQAQVLTLKCMGKCCSRIAACSWFIVIFFGTLAALFAMLFVPITSAVSDVCTVLPDLPLMAGKMGGDQTMENISTTCWDPDSNLFDGLWMHEEINVDGIDFSNFTQTFDDPEISQDGLDTLENILNEMKSSNSACDRNATGGLNVDGSNQKTYPNIDAVLASSYRTRVQINATERAFKNDPTAKRLQAGGKMAVDAIKCGIDGFRNASGCHFVKTTWNDFVDIFCAGTNESISWLGIASLLLAILAFPYTVTVLCIMRRYGGLGPNAHDDLTEADAIELAMIDDGGSNPAGNPHKKAAGYYP